MKSKIGEEALLVFQRCTARFYKAVEQRGGTTDVALRWKNLVDRTDIWTDIRLTRR
jgi:hypothetical protein